jgi:hypothetical protein
MRTISERGFCMKKVIIVFLIILIVFAHSVSFAKHEYAAGIDRDTAAADIIVDIMVTRPIGVIGLVGGSVLFVVTWPIAAVTRSVERTKKAFVTDPYLYTFVRPLGDIRGEKQY